MALVIIIVLMAIGWGYTYYHYKSKLDEISQSIGAESTSDLESKISALRNELSACQNKVSQLNNELGTCQDHVSRLNNQLATYQSQLSRLNDIVNLRLSETLVDRKTVNEPASSCVQWKFHVNYAGYIVVTVHSSTTDKTYVEVVYNSYGAFFYQKVKVGSSGTAVFPVLPGTITVRVCNNNFINGATQVVSITYHY